MILCIPPKTLTAEQKRQISKKGVIVIETNEPEKVKVINPETSMDTSDWFLAALHALKTSMPTSKAEHFVNDLYRRLESKSTAINQNS